MVFTKEKIEDLKSLATEYEQLVNNDLYLWANEVAKELGFTSGVKDIEFKEVTFSFVGIWYGSYQSEDYRGFTFKYEELLRDPQEVAAEILNKDIKEKQNKESEQLKKQEEIDRQNYLKLKKQFEGGDSEAEFFRRSEAAND